MGILRWGSKVFPRAMMPLSFEDTLSTGEETDGGRLLSCVSRVGSLLGPAVWVAAVEGFVAGRAMLEVWVGQYSCPCDFIDAWWHTEVCDSFEELHGGKQTGY
jgi:hypothetical protein